MKQSAYDRAKDSKAADEGSGPPRHLMCGADGCPNLWSSDLHGHLCRWHANAPKECWPEVTQQQQWDETERAQMRSMPKPHAEPLTRAAKSAIVARLRELTEGMRTGPADPKAWAHQLRNREELGERLNERQRSMWREALKTELEAERSVQEAA